jgi:hypothetical protein
MSEEFSPKQRLLLWKLVAAGGSEWQPHFANYLRAKEREALVKVGYVKPVKKNPTPEEQAKWFYPKTAKKKGKARGKPAQKNIKRREAIKQKETTLLCITEKGKEYLLNTYTDDFNLHPRMGVCHLIPTLSLILKGLKASSHGEELMSQILGLTQAPASARPGAGSKATEDGPSNQAPTELTPESLLRMIATIHPSNFMASGGLRISVIKNNLPYYAHKDIDQALLALEKKGAIVIYHFDDPTRISQADRELGLVKAGVTRHYIFIR